MFIRDIKDDPVLQVSGQEPSSSSKHPHSCVTSITVINLKHSGYLPQVQPSFLFAIYKVKPIFPSLLYFEPQGPRPAHSTLPQGNFDIK